MDPVQVAAQQSPAPVVVTLVRIALSTGVVRLCSGGAVAYAGETYTSKHPLYGHLSRIDTLSSGAGGQVTRATILIEPFDDDGVAALTSPLQQGAEVKIWWGAVNVATGQMAGDPELKFEGELDFARFTAARNWSVTLECGTQAERQLEPNGNWRLNHAFHAAVWPGETGLIYVTDVTKKIYWRLEAPSGSISVGGGGSTGGGFGGQDAFLR